MYTDGERRVNWVRDSFNIIISAVLIWKRSFLSLTLAVRIHSIEN